MRRYASLTIAVFALLSVASSKPKKAPEKSTTTTTSASDPSKTATLTGSCDRSGTFHLDCSESFSPAKAEEEKRKCESIDGKWKEAVACPRMKALTQCFQGNPPYLAGHYAYEGNKRPAVADDCARGYRDYRKTPELTAAPASCDAIATGGSCSQYSVLDADHEKKCLLSSGRIEQPPKPCPTKDALMALKFTNAGVTEIETFYKTPYKAPGSTTSDTWGKTELTGLCKLGENCSVVPVAGDEPPAKATNAGASKAKAKTKK